MSTAAHTPGPWTFDGDWGRIPMIFGADRSEIASVAKDDFVHGKFPGIGSMVPKASRDANARLIVEAPNMIAALNAAAGYLLNAKIDLETGAPKKTALATIEGGLKLVRAAIAKAESAA